MAILSSYPCQFALGMVLMHASVLMAVAYKHLQLFGLQEDRINHKTFSARVNKALLLEIVLQIAVLALLLLHNEIILALVVLPYSIVNIRRYFQETGDDAQATRIFQPSFMKNSENSILIGYVCHGIGMFGAVMNFLRALHLHDPRKGGNALRADSASDPQAYAMPGILY